MPSKSWVMTKPSKTTIAEVKAAVKSVLANVEFPLENPDDWKDFVLDAVVKLLEFYPRWSVFTEDLHVLTNPTYAKIYHTMRNACNSRATEAERARAE